MLAFCALTKSESNGGAIESPFLEFKIGERFMKFPSICTATCRCSCLCGQSFAFPNKTPFHSILSSKRERERERQYDAQLVEIQNSETSARMKRRRRKSLGESSRRKGSLVLKFPKGNEDSPSNCEPLTRRRR